jgi:hypothetical protein
MKLLEVHQLETLCKELGPGKMEAVLLPWDDTGAHTLMLKKGTDSWMVRIKHHNRARVFKTVTPALLICKRCGLTSVTIKLDRES